MGFIKFRPAEAQTDGRTYMHAYTPYGDRKTYMHAYRKTDRHCQAVIWPCIQYDFILYCPSKVQKCTWPDQRCHSIRMKNPRWNNEKTQKTQGVVTLNQTMLHQRQWTNAQKGLADYARVPTYTVINHSNGDLNLYCLCCRPNALTNQPPCPTYMHIYIHNYT